LKGKSPDIPAKKGGLIHDKKRGQGWNQMDGDEEREDSLNNAAALFRCHCERSAAVS
jgi:hypothetical protein